MARTVAYTSDASPEERRLDREPTESARNGREPAASQQGQKSCRGGEKDRVVIERRPLLDRAAVAFGMLLVEEGVEHAVALELQRHTESAPRCGMNHDELGVYDHPAPERL